MIQRITQIEMEDFFRSKKNMFFPIREGLTNAIREHRVSPL